MKPKLDCMAEDKETIITYSKYHTGDWAEVYTTDKDIMKRFEKFCNQHSEYARLIKEDNTSMTFSVHPKCACIYPVAPRKVTMTEEQKQVLRDRLNEIRNRK